MVTIKNRILLIEKGEIPLLREARALALHSLECALNAAEPKQLLVSKLKLQDSRLLVDGCCFDLQKFRNIYVVGGGKAGGAMAQALEGVLGKYVTSGVISVPYGLGRSSGIIELQEASHPVPDEAGVEGTRRMLAIAEKAEEDDLLICLISGGGSSLMALPREGISLKDKQELTKTLLKSGAAISEINAVRKHLSAFKGGWLAKKASPATILNLILSDVVGDQLDSIASGPTVPDLSTFKDAVNVLEKYGLWTNAPSDVRKVLTEGIRGQIEETPKPGDVVFRKVCTGVIGNNRTASLAALDYLKSNGLNALLLSASLEGEAKYLGSILASMAREIWVSGNPVRRPSAIVAGGEATVAVKGEGVGGRNQELALSAATKISGVKGCVVASLSTDGVDGPNDAAGAIVDYCTLQRAKELELVPEEFLERNDSYRFFSKLGDLIFTGPTNTNVNDVSVIVVL
jgi:hydroxypyruvate reductase